MLNLLVSLVFAALLLLFLGAIIRVSIRSALQTRGAAARLRRPDAPGVAAVCGFEPVPELVEFFLAAPIVERCEFELVDQSRTPPVAWSIGAFVPLCPQDVKARRAIAGPDARDGIPIADDLDKGVYVVLRGGRIVLRSPDVPGREVPVAGSVHEFASFQPRAPADVQPGGR